ncbi:GxxExxY protein [Algoriphagus resistens]|uniref:GxxExxY protein n=1 Tax=Algoriphagus resistens TaxID=1750590 RepID=UPI0009EA39BE
MWVALLRLLVERKLVLELKSVETLNCTHVFQGLNYVKPGNFNLGLLRNFDVSLLNYGI